MDIVSSYSFASLGWHLTQALPLIVWPQAINGLLTIDSSAAMHPANAVENYFARSLGFALLALGACTVVLTGALPMTSLADVPAEEGISPYASAVILVTTLHHASAAFYCWSKYSGTDQTGFLFGFAGSAFMAAFGLWCVMFGGDKARLSKKTGADKRTSGFPFGTKRRKDM